MISAKGMVNMAGMEEAIKNLMMQRAMQGGGAPTGGSMPMAPGGQGAPMPSAGGGAMSMAAGGAPGGGMPQINPELLKAVMAAKAGGGKGAPAAKGKAAPKSKPASKDKGKAPAKGGKGKPVPKKAAR